MLGPQQNPGAECRTSNKRCSGPYRPCTVERVLKSAKGCPGLPRWPLETRVLSLHGRLHRGLEVWTDPLGPHCTASAGRQESGIRSRGASERTSVDGPDCRSAYAPSPAPFPIVSPALCRQRRPSANSQSIGTALSPPSASQTPEIHRRPGLSTPCARDPRTQLEERASW